MGPHIHTHTRPYTQDTMRNSASTQSVVNLAKGTVLDHNQSNEVHAEQVSGYVCVRARVCVCVCVCEGVYVCV